jgi:hypothetical protein
MGSKSEKGHAVNAANFMRIVQYCAKLGVAYTPPSDEISLVNLESKVVEMQTAIEEFNVKGATWMKVVNERETAIEPLNRLLTRVRNLVKACNVSQAFKDDVSSLVKEIQGVRAKPKIVAEPENPLVPTGETVVYISAAQTGYDNRLNNFDRLIELLKTEPNYLPEEDDLKIAALEALQDLLVEKNTGVAVKTPDVDYGRIDRDNKMYSGEGNGADLAGKIKAYFKAKFGGNSQEYHAITKWEYKKLVK